MRGAADCWALYSPKSRSHFGGHVFERHLVATCHRPPKRNAVKSRNRKDADITRDRIKRAQHDVTGLLAVDSSPTKWLSALHILTVSLNF